MRDDSAVRVGIVGCGDISHEHAIAAQAIPDKVRFVACCDIRDAAAQAWAKQYRCASYYTDYMEMIGAERLDAVLLATWPAQHREQVERCFEAGVRNILCEKALTLTGSDAVELYTMVRAHDAFLMEGFMYRLSTRPSPSWTRFLPQERLEQLTASERISAPSTPSPLIRVTPTAIGGSVRSVAAAYPMTTRAIV